MSGQRARFEALVQDLRDAPGIELQEAELRPPASQQSLDTARTYCLYELPAGVEELYSEMDGCTIAWHSSDGAGCIDLVPVARIFGNWRGTTWFDDFEGGDRFRDVKPFDIFVSEACGAFIQEPMAPPQAETTLHVFGEDTVPLGLTFPEYIDKMLEARGTLYWQRRIAPTS